MGFARLYRKFEKCVEKADRILIISHRKPDADTLGSAVAMKIYLGREGKEVVMACIDRPSDDLRFLPHIDDFVSKFDLNSFDLLIFVDVAASYMTGFHEKYDDLFDSVPSINIDHHPSNDRFAGLNIIDDGAASTTVILYRLFTELGVPIDGKMATSLLAGVYGDTGSFMHSNTSGEVYVIAADLMNRGAKIAEVSRLLFNTKPVSQLKIWGKVLENAYITKRKVIMSVVTTNGSAGLGGAVEYLNMVPDTKFAVLINDDRRGHVKGSLRTRNDDIDLSKVAARYGGGGHSKASGFSVSGKLEKGESYRIVSEDMSKKSLEF